MKLFATTLSLTLLAAGAQAGGLVPSQIDATARWIGHFDLQGFHDSRVYQAMLDADQNKDIERGLSELFNTSGIDLFRDVRGLTLYGSAPDDKSGVALISTTSSVEPALATWRDKLHAKPVVIGGQPCFEWKDGDDSFSCLRATPDSTDRLLVISHSQDGLAHALEVLDGKRASLATQPSTELSTTLQRGTFAFLAATGIFDQTKGLGGASVGIHKEKGEHGDLEISASGDGPESVIARLAQGLRVEIGENGGQIFADVHLRTAREEDATKLQQIVQGLMALASFAADEPDVGATLGRWLKAVQMNRQGSTLELSFAYDLATLIREARAIEALENEKRENGTPDKDK